MTAWAPWGGLGPEYSPPWPDTDKRRVPVRSSGSGQFVQQLLSLTSEHSDPERAAQDVLDKLQAVPVGTWSSQEDI